MHSLACEANGQRETYSPAGLHTHWLLSLETLRQGQYLSFISCIVNDFSASTLHTQQPCLQECIVTTHLGSECSCEESRTKLIPEAAFPWPIWNVGLILRRLQRCAEVLLDDSARRLLFRKQIQWRSELLPGLLHVLERGLPNADNCDRLPSRPRPAYNIEKLLSYRSTLPPRIVPSIASLPPTRFVGGIHVSLLGLVHHSHEHRSRSG